MDEMKLDRTIRETLKNCAEGLQAPQNLDARVKFALRSPVPAKRHTRTWTKRLIAVAAVASMAVTGALAGGGVVTWSSHGYHDQGWTDFSDTASYVQKVLPDMKYLESFSNGFSFMDGMEMTTAKEDENYNVLGTFTSIELRYQKDDAELTFTAEPVQVEGVYESKFDTVREINGVKVRYREMRNIFLPPDGSELPSDEEQAMAASGEINIAYGVESREEKVYYTVSWIEDNINYRLAAFDPQNLSQEDFFQMAAELIQSNQ